MSNIVWTSSQKNLSNNLKNLANVTGTDWMSFMDAIGWMENAGKYDGLGGYNNAYAGMYQVDNAELGGRGIHFYDGIGAQLFGITNRTDFAKNPIAQDIAAIMEFSGIPNVVGAFSGRYSAVYKGFLGKGFTDAD